MRLPAGTLLGPYEIAGLIGAGGMGEVYRARDTRLGRDVAVKVLPATFAEDSDRLFRFEQEARALAAVSHPNIVTMFDVGTHEGSPYVVSELLEGETLRERLRDGALPQRKAVDLGLQIVGGLAAAHEKGIVHRDLKPENVFVTRDGRAKVLDFGLAKLTAPLAVGAAQSAAPTLLAHSKPGVILGTVGYMSPEQVRGLPLDHRSDIFAFGAILYEMLTGRRAFRGDSAVETMNAILKEEPAELSGLSLSYSPGLERIVRHCLEKSPGERFQSARDLCFDLETVSVFSSGPSGAPAPISTKISRRRLLKGALATAAASAVGYGLFRAGVKYGETAPPSFTRLTFRRGAIGAARFAPDGSTIVYGAHFEGHPVKLFSMRTDSPESRTLDLPNADVLSVSSTGEMAVRLVTPSGTTKLARVALGGGAPREVLDDVGFADWSPDGQQIAVARWAAGKYLLEYPIGNVLYETTGWISDVRVSPDGRKIAFVDHPVNGDELGVVAMVDAKGKKTALTGEWASARGLVWCPSGDEIWFTATDRGTANALRAVTPGGDQRLVARVAGRMKLQDISRDGRDRVLLAVENKWGGVMAVRPDEDRERPLGWLDGSQVADLSDDGSTVLLTEAGEGGGSSFSVYVRKTDGSPAVKLGEGEAAALSPDGRWALSMLRTSPSQLVLLPTGAGSARALERGPIEQYHWAKFLPDGKRVLFAGYEPGATARVYLQDLDGGGPRPIPLDGVKCFPNAITPDGAHIAGFYPDREGYFLFPVDGGEARPLGGLEPGEKVIRWSADGKSLYVYRYRDVPATVMRLDLATGRRTPLREIGPADPAGIGEIYPVLITPDEKSYVYGYTRVLSDLYLASGVA